MSRFVRHLKNRMLRFPAQILPMMGFSSCDNSDIFQWLKLVSIGGSCSEPFSRLHRKSFSVVSGESNTNVPVVMLVKPPGFSSVGSFTLKSKSRLSYTMAQSPFVERSWMIH